jgi:hypothetical protein
MLTLEILGYVFIGICTVYTAGMVYWVKHHDNPGAKLQKHIEKIQVRTRMCGEVVRSALTQTF